MRINFEDGSYIEVQRSQNAKKVWVTISTVHPENPTNLIANSAEVDVAEFKKAFESEVGAVVLNQ